MAWRSGGWLVVFMSAALAAAPKSTCQAELPDPAKVEATKLFEVEGFSEGVCFDRHGNGYFSAAANIYQFTPDGKLTVWATTGAPDGHKILPDGTHLVCEIKQHAIIHLTADAKPLPPAAIECDGKPFAAPNDLSLDTPNDGFYFTDPDPGKLYYTDRQHKTHLAAEELTTPNGVVLSPDGKKVYVGEVHKNRVLLFDVAARASSPTNECSSSCRSKTRPSARWKTSPTAFASTPTAISTWPTTACSKCRSSTRRARLWPATRPAPHHVERGLWRTEPRPALHHRRHRQRQSRPVPHRLAGREGAVDVAQGGELTAPN